MSDYERPTPDFGWSLPPGCRHSDIDRAFGGDEPEEEGEEMYDAYDPWPEPVTHDDPAEDIDWDKLEAADTEPQEAAQAAASLEPLICSRCGGLITEDDYANLRDCKNCEADWNEEMNG